MPDIMSKSKADVVREVAFRADLTAQNAVKAVDAFTNTVREALAADHDVQLTGFGTFTTSHRQARAGCNPHTGEPVVVPPMRLATFRPSAALVEDVNQ